MSLSSKVVARVFQLNLRNSVISSRQKSSSIILKQLSYSPNSLCNTKSFCLHRKLFADISTKTTACSEAMGALSPLDPSSYSRPEKEVIKHISLALNVDFTKQVLSGQATLEFEVLDEINDLILDVSNLKIESVEAEDGTQLQFKLSDHVPNFGSKLTVLIPKKLSSSDKTDDATSIIEENAKYKVTSYDTFKSSLDAINLQFTGYMYSTFVDRDSSTLMDKVSMGEASIDEASTDESWIGEDLMTKVAMCNQCEAALACKPSMEEAALNKPLKDEAVTGKASNEKTAVHNASKGQVATVQIAFIKTLKDKIAAFTEASNSKTTVDKAAKGEVAKDEASKSKDAMDKPAMDVASKNENAINKAATDEALKGKDALDKPEMDVASKAKAVIIKVATNEASNSKDAMDKPAMDVASKAENALSKAATDKASKGKDALDKPEMDVASKGEAAIIKAATDEASKGKDALDKPPMDVASKAEAAISKAATDESSKGKDALDKPEMDVASKGEAAIIKAAIIKAATDEASKGKDALDKPEMDVASKGEAAIIKAAMDEASKGKDALDKPPMDAASKAKAAISKAATDESSKGKDALDKPPLDVASKAKDAISKAASVIRSFIALKGKDAMDKPVKAEEAIPKVAMDEASKGKDVLDKPPMDVASKAEAAISKAATDESSKGKDALDKPEMDVASKGEAAIIKAAIIKAATDEALKGKDALDEPPMDVASKAKDAISKAATNEASKDKDALDKPVMVVASKAEEAISKAAMDEASKGKDVLDKPPMDVASKAEAAISKAATDESSKGKDALDKPEMDVASKGEAAIIKAAIIKAATDEALKGKDALDKPPMDVASKAKDAISKAATNEASKDKDALDKPVMVVASKAEEAISKAAMDEASKGRDALDKPPMDVVSKAEAAIIKAVTDEASKGKDALDKPALDVASKAENAITKVVTDKASKGKDALDKPALDVASKTKNVIIKAVTDEASKGKDAMDEPALDVASKAENVISKAATDEAAMSSGPSSIVDVLERSSYGKLKSKGTKGRDTCVPVMDFDATRLKIKIKYSTDPTASALQWLDPEQTSGKKYPYLFSQCQPIHARSILPCQDTPAVKFTYDAEVTAPEEFTVLMSALRGEVKSNKTSFRQPMPLPSYLVAIAVGVLESRQLGPRSKVWSEKEEIERSAWEFAETEKYLQAAENLCGPYEWLAYDLLVLPPSFPYGGMENPCLTFVTPTLLAGDRSQADVIVHEIMHSWTGNLVTNRNFEHFWLNEGFTVFLERKVGASLINDSAEAKKSRDFHSLLGLQELSEAIQVFGASNVLTNLVVDLKGIHPDDAFSRVPYEKGSLFLRYLEDLVGGPAVFDEFLRSYLTHFSKKSLDTDQFKAYLLNYFKGNDKLNAVDWDTWLYKSGMPPVIPDYDTTMTKAISSLVLKIDNAKESISPADVTTFTPHQMIHLLQQLIDGEPLPLDRLKALGEDYKVSSSKNTEIQYRWLRLCVRSKDQSKLGDVFNFVNSQGRMKYVRPLYRDLYAWQEVRDQAIDNFLKHEKNMMHVSAYTLRKDLHLTEKTKATE